MQTQKSILEWESFLVFFFSDCFRSAFSLLIGCWEEVGRSDSTSQIQVKNMCHVPLSQLPLAHMTSDLRTHRCCRRWPCGWSPAAAPSQRPPAPPAAPPLLPKFAGCLHKTSPDLKSNMFHYCVTYSHNWITFAGLEHYFLELLAELVNINTLRSDVHNGADVTQWGSRQEVRCHLWAAAVWCWRSEAGLWLAAAVTPPSSSRQSRPLPSRRSAAPLWRTYLSAPSPGPEHARETINTHWFDDICVNYF